MNSTSNASQLTKLELRNELLRNNIELPPGDIGKNVLVDIYKEFLTSDGLTDKDLLDITQETEERFQKLKEPHSSYEKRVHLAGLKKERQPKRDKNNNKVKVDELRMAPTIDPTKLTNQELAAMLREYGVNTGPIVVTTRRIYEKKLVQCLTGQEIKSVHPPAPDDDSEEDVAPSPAYIKRTEARRRVKDKTPEPKENVNYSATDDYNRSPFSRAPLRNTSTPLKSSTKSPTSTSTASQSSSGITSVIKLVMLAVLVVIAFIVVKSFVSENGNNIPRGITTDN